MTYLDYIVLFEKHDLKQCFSGNTTRLYLKLLHLANLLGWPTEFAKSDRYVAAVCGYATNTMKDCRAQLVARGLLAIVPGGAGRGDTTNYTLLGPDKVSNSDTLSAEKVSNFDTLNSDKVSNSDTLSAEKVSEKVSNFDTPSIDKENNTSNAASAASVGPSSAKKSTTKKPKKAGADFAEIAALPLPHLGHEFAEAWLTFYTTNTKQAGKPLTAFELMLKKLGKRPEGFAVVMLEAAIQGDWSGVENPGTARAFTTWQAEQAIRPLAPLPTPPGGEPEELDEAARQFRAEQAEKAAAARTAHFARWAAKP
jgi:hypothetical protein